VPWLRPARSFVICQQQAFLRKDPPLLRAVVDLLCTCMRTARMQGAALEAFVELCLHCAPELTMKQARFRPPLPLLPADVPQVTAAQCAWPITEMLQAHCERERRLEWVCAHEVCSCAAQDGESLSLCQRILKRGRKLSLSLDPQQRDNFNMACNYMSTCADGSNRKVML
jgi:hypothetical protein